MSPTTSSGARGRSWSLRSRLAWIVVGVTAASWLVGGIAMFLVVNHASEENYDRRLGDIALSLLSFADHEISELQGTGDVVHYEGRVTIGARYRYQVWSQKGDLLLVSADTRKTALSPIGEEGVFSREIDGVPMRVVVHKAYDGFRVFEVAEPLSARAAIVDPGLLLFAGMLLASLPLLLVVGRWLVRRSTRSLGEAASQVVERGPDDLRPLTVQSPPLELMPMVVAINALFSRIGQALETERRFTSAAAHELRTPLAAIKIQSQIVQIARSEEDRRPAIGRLVLSIDNAAHMIDQLLTLARVDGITSFHAHAARAHIDTVAAMVLDEVRPIAAKKGLVIVEDLQEADVLGIEFSLAALLRNLVDNSIRYTPTGGRIRVRTYSRDGDAFAEVEDSGPGIAPELRPRVFERFYRVPGGGADGCGIGMSIVQAAVEMHGARIELTSSEALGGLRVVVRFPPTE